MDAGHGRDGEIGGRGAGEGQLQRDGQGGDEDGEPAGGEAAGEEATFPPPDKRRNRREDGVGHGGADDAHVEDVGAERQQTAVLEDQRLNADHAGEDENGGPGAEQDGRQGRAHQVPGGAAGDGEVEHLPGEDGGRQDAHHRHFTLAQFAADAPEGDGR